MPHVAILAPDPSIPALERIRFISRPFTVLFTILLVVMVIACINLTAAALFYDGPHVRASNELLTTGEGQIMIQPELTSELLASNVAGVVLGALLYVLARVMDLGREIELEKASFI